MDWNLFWLIFCVSNILLIDIAILAGTICLLGYWAAKKQLEEDEDIYEE